MAEDSEFAYHYPAADSSGTAQPMQTSSSSYEVYNRKSGAKVGGPYQTKSRARLARDKHDNAYGGYAHEVREVAGKDAL